MGNVTLEAIDNHRRRGEQASRALRKAGFRPIQIWVPDTRRKSFAEEARRLSRLVAQDPKEPRELELWTETVSCEGWR